MDGGAAKARVLVIDDEKGLREMLLYALTRRGYRVAACAGGAEGVAQARREDYDAVLCDMMMPGGMDGFATLAALLPVKPALAVILLTGCPTVEDAERAKELGARDYIAKPCEIARLCAAIDAAAGPGR